MERHLTKKIQNPLFIGIPDGEVLKKHLTTHLTTLPTILQLSTAHYRP